MSEPIELQLKYRPKLFKEVIGQAEACRVLLQMTKSDRIPHAVLFTGPSGCGKTTLARILASKLRCDRGDLDEKNAADFRGIDTVREIRTRASLHPLHGTCRVWIIDECHKLTNDAQNALLKTLEDTPSHAYFFLATTDPSKLIRTIITRCTEIKVREMSDEALHQLIKAVAEKEGFIVTAEVEDKIVECSAACGRTALVLLNKIIGIPTEQQVDAIERNASQQQAITLCRALLKPTVTWRELAPLIKAIDEEAESIRWMILSYMSAVMLGTGPATVRAAAVLEEMRDNFYDTKKAGLVRACYALSRR